MKKVTCTIIGAAICTAVVTVVACIVHDAKRGKEDMIRKDDLLED